MRSILKKIQCFPIRCFLIVYKYLKGFRLENIQAILRIEKQCWMVHRRQVAYQMHKIKGLLNR